MIKIDVLLANLGLNKVLIDNLIDLSLEISYLQPTFCLDLVGLCLGSSLSHCMALVLDCLAVCL